jgi:arylsulfatase A-like enzyme
VFVIADQMRPQAMGFMGEDPVVTPTLDRFADESLVLTDAVSSCPICSPYRAMLMTGKYPVSNGVPYNCLSRTAHLGNELRADDRCLTDVLHDRGYNQGWIGKWHLDAPYEPYVDTYNNYREPAWNEWCPPERRHNIDFWYAYNTYDNHWHPEYWVNGAPRDRRRAIEGWSPEHETDVALQYLRNEGGGFRDPNQPFALFLSHNPPHTPYEMVPDRYLAAYAGKTPEELLNRPNVPLHSDSKVMRDSKKHIKNYFAMVTGIDDQFRRVLAGLDALGLAEDTIVVFTSDHGNCIGSQGHWTKGRFWEECYRVPFLIRWPGEIPVRRDRLHLGPADLMPTMLDLMGHGGFAPSDLEGSNYASILRGEGGARPTSALYMSFTKPQSSDIGWNERGVRTDRYTMVTKKTPGAASEHWLYDNERDPYQLMNLAEAQPGLVAELTRTELHPWLEHTGDPWLKN